MRLELSFTITFISELTLEVFPVHNNHNLVCFSLAIGDRKCRANFGNELSSRFIAGARAGTRVRQEGDTECRIEGGTNSGGIAKIGSTLKRGTSLNLVSKVPLLSHSCPNACRCL